MTTKQQSPAWFLNPSKDNPKVYVGKVKDQPTEITQLDDGSIGVKIGQSAMSAQRKQGRFGDYFMIRIGDLNYFIDFKVSQRGPFCKVKEGAPKTDSAGRTERPASYGARS